MVDTGSRVGTGLGMGGRVEVKRPSSEKGSVQARWNSPGKNETRRRKQRRTVVTVELLYVERGIVESALMRDL